MKKSLSAIVLTLAIPFAAACGNDEAHNEHEGHTQEAPNGDLQETTASITDLPAFLDDKDENMRAIYLAAAKHASVIEQMPCYCGCGESAGHKSNLNCFIADQSEDEVVWDDHGTRCGVCLEIAATAAVMTEEGRSVEDIRTLIDDTYSEGYAEPTPTPLPGA